MKINGFTVIGVGGIGSALIEPLCRFVQYSLHSEEPVHITLVDGDEYEPKNLERQNMTWDDVRRNKAQVHAENLMKKFEVLEVNAIPEYVTEKNMSKAIHEGDVVLVGVDNFKSRKQISDYCAGLENVVLISGGNELTDGNVQLFIRQDGKSYTANLGDYHPEIANPRDKRPDEMSCEELVQVQPQLYFMNLQIAVLMLVVLYNVLKCDAENYGDMFGEVYTDISLCRTATSMREPLEA